MFRTIRSLHALHSTVRHGCAARRLWRLRRRRAEHGALGAAGRREPPAAARPPAAAAPAAAAARPCTPDGSLSYVCGPTNAEDIVPLGNSEWLIVSGMTPLQGPATPGKIYLVNHETKIAGGAVPRR